MKQSIKYILPVLLMISILSGCRSIKDEPQYGGEGEVQFKVKTDVRTEVVNVQTKAGGADPTYSLKVYKGAATEPIVQFEDYTQMGRLRLAGGEYRFVVESGEDVAAEFESPYFRGEKKITIIPGEVNPISITASLANVRISSEMSQLIKDNFSDYSLTIAGKTITKKDMLEGRSLYISATSGTFSWILRLTNNQGSKSEFFQAVKDVVPCSHYKFKFDIDEMNPNEGSLILDLTVDTQVTHIDVDIDISIEKHELPFMTPTSGFKLDEQQIVNEIVRGRQFRIDLLASAGIKALKIRHTNTWLLSQGVPYTFDAVSMGEGSDRDQISKAGIEWSETINGERIAFIDFTKLAAVAPLEDYKFYMTFIDNENQQVEHVFNFVVLPDQDHITKLPEYGSKYAIFNGEWCTLDMPQGMTFQYKERGSSAWISVPHDQVSLTDGKKFRARVKGLMPTTEYVVRTYAPSSGEKQGQEVSFTTYAAPEIPNLSFEEEHWSGNAWYPNASGGNSYWATGNEGVTKPPVSQSANATSESVDVYRGKAIRMTSVGIGFGLSPVKFAAGNLFTGQYATDMINPINSVKLGRPYTGRPLALRGWYKYSPVIINNNSYKGGVAGATGTMDKCHIYISLENWGTATVRPNNPNVVGYGEFKTDEKVTQYRQFNIPIEYNSSSTFPTHVVIAATASHYGGLFCGGEGSEMLIDEFELVWD